MQRFLAVVLCVLTLAGVQDTAATPSNAQSLYVDAQTLGWQSTGVVLMKNQSVMIEASGSGCFVGRACVGPNGTGENLPTDGPFVNAPWPGGPAYALVGMVGSDLVLIGSGPTLVSGSGELFLAFNDDRVDDNSGGFDVSITTCRPGKGNGDSNYCHTGAPGQS